MKIKSLSVIALLLACWASVSAKTLAEQHIDSVVSTVKVFTPATRSEEGLDSMIRNRIESFYYDQFRHAQDPGAPLFIFLSKDRNLMMGMGGTVRMRAWVDERGDMPGNGFSPAAIAMHGSGDPHLGTTPAGTCIYFRVLGTDRKVGEYQLYIEANFNGYKGRDFHLKKAYAVLGDWTAGYTSSTFSDPAAEPSTVDAGGPNNKVSHTTLLVRYMPTLAKGISAGISAEAPDNSIGADGKTTKARPTYIPDIAALLQYSWVKGQHVRLSGIMRWLPYRDLVTSQPHNVVGWGVQLSAVANPCSCVTTFVNANYGAGYAGLASDLGSGGYDLMADPDRPGVLYAPRSVGWNIGVQYNFMHNLFATASASQMRLLPSERVNPGSYKYGILALANVMWNPLPRFQLGAEVDWGARHEYAGAVGTGLRFGVLGQVSF